jgi:hypothetical protein
VARLPAIDDAGLRVDLADRELGPVRSRALILAAGTLNSTALALARRPGADRRRLLTNPLGIIAFFLPSWIGRPLAATTFSLGQLSYRLDIAELSDYATGVLYTTDGLPLAVLAENCPCPGRRPYSSRQ